MKRLFLPYLAMLCMLFSCSTSEEKRQETSRNQMLSQMRDDSLALKIAVLPTLDALPLWIANDCQFYEREQADVRLKEYNAQMDADTALMRGHVEGSLTDVVRADYLEQSGMKLHRYTFTTLSWKLIANRSARIKSTRQLGDKMVAMTRHSATDYLCDRTLQGVKTSAEVFRVQVNDVNLRLTMLDNNELDAAWLPEPQATQALLQGHQQLADSRQLKDSLGVLTFSMEAIADVRRQKQLKAFARAYQHACDTLQKSGLQPFSDIIKKHLGISQAVIDSLNQSL